MGSEAASVDAAKTLVVGLAVLEPVSILGLLLVVLGGGLANAVRLLAGGAIGLLLLRPGRTGLIAP